MQAKYATTCAACGRPISPGDEIANRPGGSGWVHADCPAAPAQGSLPGLDPAADATAAVVGGSEATEVFTDGACSGNPGPGGWAWVTEDGRHDSGGEAATTNQRMEITAALQAVRALDGPLVVVSDSTYVVNCFRDGWWRGWRRRGWVNTAKKPVKNRDLWEPLVDLVEARGDVTFRWVKGHSGHPMNDKADELAVAASAQAAEH